MYDKKYLRIDSMLSECKASNGDCESCREEHLDMCTQMNSYLECAAEDKDEDSIHNAPWPREWDLSHLSYAYGMEAECIKDILSDREAEQQKESINNTDTINTINTKHTKHTKHTKEATMSNKLSLTTIAASNKDAMLTASKITAGKVANNKIAKLLKPKLPMILRGYADSELFKVVIANVVSAAIQQYLPENAKALAVAECMMQAGAVQVMDSFDIEGMLDGFLDTVKVPGFDDKKPVKANAKKK